MWSSQGDHAAEFLGDLETIAGMSVEVMIVEVMIVEVMDSDVWRARCGGDAGDSVRLQRPLCATHLGIKSVLQNEVLLLFFLHQFCADCRERYQQLCIFVCACVFVM